MPPDPDLQQRLYGNVHTEDPLREVTRKERRALLGVSTAAIIISRTGLVPSEIHNFGIKFTSSEQSLLLVGLGAVVAYLLIAFIVYAATDWLNVMWRLHVVSVWFQQDAAMSSGMQRIDDRGLWSPHVNGPPFKFKFFAVVMGHTRRLVDFALPVALAAFALASIGIAARDHSSRPIQARMGGPEMHEPLHAGDTVGLYRKGVLVARGKVTETIPAAGGAQADKIKWEGVVVMEKGDDIRRIE